MHTLYILVPLIISVAFFGESIFGFGGGLIAIPPLSILLGVREAVTLVLVFQLLTGLLIYHSYVHINWKAAKPMSLTVIAGTIAGTLLLAYASVTILQLTLATFIILFLVK
jgi:uncharacterized membrane protein YfcA